MIGSTADNRTVFYYDEPSYIREHFLKRNVVFTAHITNGELRAEIWGLYVYSPRSSFRDVAISRTRDTTNYLIDQMYRYFGSAPDQETIDAYYKTVKDGAIQADLSRGPLELAEGTSAKALEFAKRYWPIPAGVVAGLVCGLWARRRQRGSQLNR